MLYTRDKVTGYLFSLWRVKSWRNWRAAREPAFIEDLSLEAKEYLYLQAVTRKRRMQTLTD
jgi:hypothetical protein